MQGIGILRTAAGTALFFTVFVGTSVSGVPAECGDIDANGTVTATDALLVLHKAVGLPIEYNCDSGITTTTTTSTTTNTGDLCFTDEDCEAYVGPGYHCGGPTGYDCVECEFNYHCQPGEECVYFECVPSGQ